MDLLRRIRATFTAWRATAWTGSTIAEIDTDTGELICVPGQFPDCERSLRYRWQRWLALRQTAKTV